MIKMNNNRTFNKKIKLNRLKIKIKKMKFKKKIKLKRLLMKNKTRFKKKIKYKKSIKYKKITFSYII